MIKRNESDVADIVFEILAKKEFNQGRGTYDAISAQV